MYTQGSFSAFYIPHQFLTESASRKRQTSPCYNYLYRLTTFIVPTARVVQLFLSFNYSLRYMDRDNYILRSTIYFVTPRHITFAYDDIRIFYYARITPPLFPLWETFQFWEHHSRNGTPVFLTTK
jgi:hypothetical protein